MKKLVTLLICLLFFNTVQASSNCYEEFKCPEETGLTSSYTRIFSNLTKNKFLAEKIKKEKIKKNIKKTAQGDFSVKIKSYSATDMKAGRFKSFELNGKDVNFEGIYLSEFNLKTICDFNYINLDKDWNMTVVNNLPMTFDLTITDADLNKTMSTEEYTRVLNDINMLGSGLFTIESSELRIKNDKIYYILKYAIPFVRKPQEVVISAGLTVKNGDIRFADARILNKDFKLKAEKLSSVLNYINPLDFSVKILENKDARLNIKDVSIADNKITVDGTVILLKDIIKE